MWKYVEFFRNNEDKVQLLEDYINYCTKRIHHKNDKIMEVVKEMCQTPDEDNKKAITAYTKRMLELTKMVDKKKKESKHSDDEDSDEDD